LQYKQQDTPALATPIKPRLRGVLHQGAFLVSLITGTVLVVLASGVRATVSAAIYGVSVALLFGISAAYHRGSWSPSTRQFMQRLDHSMIFVLIAGTYTPFAMLLVHGSTRWLLLGVVWGGAAIGVVALTVFRSQSRWRFTVLYLVLGWVALAVLPALIDSGGTRLVALILLGGLFYSAGAVVYALKRPDPLPRWFGFHSHAMAVLDGAAAARGAAGRE
jgi:hemolysin III